MQEVMIETKLDGLQPFNMMEKEDFQGRVTEIYQGDFGNMNLTDSIPIPDDEILCDFCNEGIENFPVPVYRGSYALCPKCFKNIKRGF